MKSVGPFEIIREKVASSVTWLPHCCIVAVAVLGLNSCHEKKSSLFAEGKSRGRAPLSLKETSGIVAATSHADSALWVVNDGGNTAEVFLINDSAKILMKCRLKGIENRDWEAISVLQARDSQPSFLYVGDIGDNDAVHDIYYIHRFIEPLYRGKSVVLIDEIETLSFQFTDGSRDMEALAVDPQHGTIYVFSKREENISVYELLRKNLQSMMLTPRRIAVLPYHNTVSADFSPDGTEFLLKTYSKIMYWKRLPDEHVQDMIQRQPETLAYDPEPQGESIAWAQDGTGFYTMSESTVTHRAHLYFYRRK